MPNLSLKLHPHVIIVQLISQSLNLTLASSHGAQAMRFGFVFLCQIRYETEAKLN